MYINMSLLHNHRLTMNIKQLRLFYETHASGSLTYAAERTCVTQPAASKLLRSLEEEVGMQLFSREGRNLKPSAGTTHLFEEVRGLLERFDDLEKSFKVTSKGGRGNVAISGTVGRMMGIVPAHIQSLLSDSPGIKLELRANDNLQIRELAATGKIDIGLTDAAPGSHRYSSKLIKMRCIVGLHSSNPLAAKTKLSAQDMSYLKWITFGPNHGTHTQLNQMFIEHDAMFNADIFVDNTIQALQLVDLGLGATVVDPISYRLCNANGFYPNVSFVQIAMPIYEMFDIVWPNCRQLSKPAELLLQAIQKDASGLRDYPFLEHRL